MGLRKILKKLFKRKHKFTENDRIKSELVRTSNAIRKEQLKVAQDKLKELKEIREKLKVKSEYKKINEDIHDLQAELVEDDEDDEDDVDYDNEDDEDDEDDIEQEFKANINNIFKQILNKPTTTNINNKLSDKDIGNLIMQIPYEKREQLKQLSDVQLKKLIMQQYRGVAPDDVEHAISLLKNM